MNPRPGFVDWPLFSALNDMQIAAGLGAMPRIVVLESPTGSVNALALGTTRSRPSGTARVERVEQRRHDRLREVLGTEGLAAEELRAE